jgi:hypothetical protein
MIPTDDVDCAAITENNKFAQINPLLTSLKHKIDEDTARFQREYDFEGNDLSLFPMHKQDFKNVLIQLFVKSYEKDKDNLFNGLQNYPIDLFYDEDDKDTGIIPYAKGHISDYITEKINLIHIPNRYI